MVDSIINMQTCYYICGHKDMYIFCTLPYNQLKLCPFYEMKTFHQIQILRTYAVYSKFYHFGSHEIGKLKFPE